NSSIFRLMHWFYSSGSKTLADLERLVYKVLLAPDFKVSDFLNFSASHEQNLFDKFISSEPTSHQRNPTEARTTDLPFSTSDIWYESTVNVPLPSTRSVHMPEMDAPTIEVKFHHRKLVEVIKSGFQDRITSQFHWKGFKQFWKPSENEPAERVYGEAFTSNKFLNFEDKIEPVRGCTLETVVVPLFIYSDGTLLANFGTASLWPIYLWFGNLSKYVRSKPSAYSAHHLAYLPSVPDLVQDTYKESFGKAAADPVITFIKRDLVQAVWSHLLDAEFLEAYKNGIVVKCGDEIWRRLYPRFFVYSADYPEKTLLAGLQQKGTWFCPTCLTKLEQIWKLGMKMHDKIWSRKFRIDSARIQEKINNAREWIFGKGVSVSSVKIKDYLGNSICAIRNAFSNILLQFEENYYELFARDLMHEYELGVWRSVLTHLLRMLYTYGMESITKLNHRFRLVPSFGRSTIRRFRNDVSALKNVAARDFEDILQCAGPCFEGLFSATSKSLDRKLQQLIFVMAWWHASAKLRVHTDSSLHYFRGVTDLLTKSIRDFTTNISPQFNTRETPKEAGASARRKAAADPKGKQKAVVHQHVNKPFQLNAPKMHFLVHYADCITENGTTDSYSTQIGEQEHRTVKRTYERTNKKDIEKQLSKHERRLSRLRVMQEIANDNDDDLRTVQKEELPPSNPIDHHHMSLKKHRPLSIGSWLSKHDDDPAFKNFIPKLHGYILSQLLSADINITDELRRSLIVLNETIYLHNSIRVNFTTYDNRREQDLINPRTHADIMVLNGNANDDHPFSYARVIGVFHTMARLRDQRQYTMVEFLWVRWFQLEKSKSAIGGFTKKRLHQVKYIKGDKAFNFLHPSEVIRGIHLIPRFAGEQTTRLLGPSIARRENEMDMDWETYYINMFADRDLFMRFCGGGIGHGDHRQYLQDFATELARLFGNWNADAEVQAGSEDENGDEDIGEDEVETDDETLEKGDADEELLEDSDEDSDRSDDIEEEYGDE
ncbi:hypothetical protein AGABI2DRAFT_47183, partial [Agaricus bisporus var. bisporus H97]|uniref:hypothetical protein n=1 Tax=Agaricus bisporus var. bisporus (strain H97 / ATCC MYA-4626 / FGSC 10389) TaxID=936046 RepID=UPI00029F6070